MSQAEEPACAAPQFEVSRGRRILVADDDISIRQFNTRALLRSGYHVVAVEDGAEGWDALHASRFDLLITDNNMPKVTGVELVKMLHATGMAMPVIMVTGAAPTEELKRHPWLQIAAILLKPFTVDELLRTVKEVLRTSADASEQFAPLSNLAESAIG